MQLRGCPVWIIRRRPQSAGIQLIAYAPDAQVHQLGLAGVRRGCDDFVNFLEHWRIHFPVEQNFSDFDDEFFRPHRDQYCTDDSHHRIELGPSERPPAGQRADR